MSRKISKYQLAKEKLDEIGNNFRKIFREYMEGWTGVDFEKTRNTSILNGYFSLCLLLLTAPYWSSSQALAEKAIYSALFGGSISFITPYILYLKRKRKTKDKNLR